MTAGRSILMEANLGRGEVIDAIDQVVRACTAEGIEVCMVASVARRSGTAGVTAVPGDIDRAAVGCELVLVLGGDGTFLRASEYARAADVPVLGVNLGRIGFLAESEVTSLREVVRQIARREYRVEERMTVDVAVLTGDRLVERGWALNEMSLEKTGRQGVLEVSVEVDGRPVSDYGCDGVLVSTPTGSTAYAFSAGGPIVWPEVEALLVVPNNAHALFARPLVVAPTSTVAVETAAASVPAVAVLDGRRSVEIPPGSRIEVVAGARRVKWVRIDDSPFTDRLVRKFRLPVTGWRGRGDDRS